MTRGVDYIQLYLSELSRHEVELTLLVTVTIGVVALIFAIAVFLIWRENRSVLTLAHEHLRSIEKRRAEIDTWYSEKKTALDAYLRSELDKFNNQIEEMRCYATLIMALEKTGAHAAVIYPALCFLAERPCALYVAVFREIIKLSITNDITERAEQGLRKWEQMEREQASKKGS